MLDDFPERLTDESKLASKIHPGSKIDGFSRSCMMNLIGPMLAILTVGVEPRSAWAEPPILLRPARVFDGTAAEPHEGWAVLVRGEKIEAVGPAGEVKVPEGARVIELPGMTVLPGLIDAHTHVLLHPYNEASWNDQVLKEPQALRVCRAVNHLKSNLLSGFTTIRDLGTEGAGYADVGLKQAVEQGIVPGPRMLVTTRAIVATGSYAPKGFAPEWRIPQGAEEADGVDALIRVVRDQIGKGADWIKVYADAAMGGGPARPSFSLDEFKLIVETARSNGVPVAAHASSTEGMRRAALAGVATIEHGYGGDPEVFRLMAERGVALCPTITATEVSATPLPRLAPGRRSRAQGDRELEAPLQASARGWRDHRQWQRHGGLRARRGRPRDRAHGRIRHEAGRGPPGGDLGRRQGAAARQPAGGRQAGPAGRSHRRRGRSDSLDHRAPQGPAGDEGGSTRSATVKATYFFDLGPFAFAFGPFVAFGFAGFVASARLAVEKRDELLGGDGSIALVDPFLEKFQRNVVIGPEPRLDPAALAEPVTGGLRKGVDQRHTTGLWKLGAEAQPLFVASREHKNLVSNLDNPFAPREILVRLRIPESEGTQAGFMLSGFIGTTGHGTSLLGEFLAVQNPMLDVLTMEMFLSIAGALRPGSVRARCCASPRGAHDAG